MPEDRTVCPPYAPLDTAAAGGTEMQLPCPNCVLNTEGNYSTSHKWDTDHTDVRR